MGKQAAANLFTIGILNLLQNNANKPQNSPPKSAAKQFTKPWHSVNKKAGCKTTSFCIQQLMSVQFGSVLGRSALKPNQTYLVLVRLVWFQFFFPVPFGQSVFELTTIPLAKPKSYQHFQQIQQDDEQQNCLVA